MKRIAVRTAVPRFSPRSLQFLLKAGRQKDPDWLERNRAEYEELMLEPLKHLALSLKASVGRTAPGVHFPTKGIGRMRRGAQGVSEGYLFKSWMAYSASRPSGSRFESNPNLFFLMHPEDKDDPVLVAGGLYMPSSKQLRAVREAIARDARPFERLFASAEFKRHFPHGFSDEKKSARPPRGFDPAHSHIEWLKLQAFFVWKPYSLREFTSARFPQIVAGDWAQIVRLNTLLEAAIRGGANAVAAAAPVRSRGSLLDRLEGVEHRVQMDF